jgi:hypothetical protein
MLGDQGVQQQQQRLQTVPGPNPSLADVVVAAMTVRTRKHLAGRYGHALQQQQQQQQQQ